MRDSFIMYRSFYEAISDLPKEDKADILDAIFEYSLNSKELELKGISKTVFKLIKPILEANNKRYENGNKPKKTKNPDKKDSKDEANGSETEAKDKQGLSETEENGSKDEANKDKNENEDKNKNENVDENENLDEEPEPQKPEVPEFIQQQQQEFRDQVKAGEKLNVEQTKEYLTTNETAWMEFRKDTKVLEFDIFKKLINEFGNVVIGKEGELYPRTKGKSLNHFKYFIINRFKDNPSLFKATPPPAPEKKPVSKMNSEEFKAYKIAENLEQERDFAQNEIDRQKMAKMAQAKRDRETDAINKPQTIYPWMQMLSISHAE